MNVLVTGGAGFIGSHLVTELVSRGDRVYVVDDLSTGMLENLDHVRNSECLSLIVGSILDERLMAEMIGKCDIVYHLAASVGVKYIMENRLRAIQVNTRGTQVVLELASRSQRKVMVASSSEVYGKNAKGRLSEDDDSILGPTTVCRWSYSSAKRLGEELALA